MLFDELCKVASKNGDVALEKLLRKTHLFHFPYRAEDVLPKAKDLNAIDHNLFMNELIIPFDNVAIEDEMGIVFIENRDGSVGANKERKYWIAFNFISNIRKQDIPEAEELDPKLKQVYAVCECVASVDKFNEDGQMSVSTSIQSFRFMGVSKHEQVRAKEFASTDMLSNKDAIHQDVSSSVKTALEELYFMQSNHDRFILEASPIKAKSGKAVPRSHQRSLYTLLALNTIRTRLGHNKDPQSSLEAGHFRRKHYRYLRNDKYKRELDGSTKKIAIDAMWVGPQESIDRNNRYRVRLDL